MRHTVARHSAAKGLAEKLRGLAATSATRADDHFVDHVPHALTDDAVMAASSRHANSVDVHMIVFEQSAVLRVEYSLDASRWRVAYPVDGIPDSRREEFEVTLDEAEAARNLIIRVTDAMNNVATAVAEIKR